MKTTNITTRIIENGQRNSSPHEGVVLIMVLGLLSVMIIMAVSFAVAMRTERLAAGNSLDSVKANQLARTALHLAMADIYQRLHMVERETCTVDIASSRIIVTNASLYPLGAHVALHNVFWTSNPVYAISIPPNVIQIASSPLDATNGVFINLSSYDSLAYTRIIKREATNGYPYPPWGAIASYSTNSIKRPVSLTNDALKYIPASLISSVTVADAASQTNYWINIEASANGKTTTVGRVAYLIANCSGLLDANYVGGSNRADGTHPAEIAIEYLAEIGDADKQSFIDYRAASGSFETLPKLAGWKPSWQPSNLFCYSGFLENEWVQDNLDVRATGGKADISGDADKLRANQNSIMAAFAGSGLTNAGEAGTAYTNLLDYVDPDSVPRDLHVSVEAVPMINEIMLSNTVTIVGSSNYYLVNNIVVELSYPFGFNNTTPFDIELNAAFAPDHPSYPNFTLPPISMSSTVSCSSASFKILTFTSTNNVVLQPLQPPPSELKWRETITRATVKWSGQTVDQLDNSLSCTVTSSLPLGPTRFVSAMDKECVDPRFNWDADSTNQWSTWSAGQSSVGDVNLITKSYWSSHSGCDSTMAMEVNNRPLQALSELTHLIYSAQPWTTIDPATHSVYDHFCLDQSSVTRGLVNPNTHIRDVLAATFYKVQAHTNGVDATTVADAQAIADAIMSGRGRGYMTLQQVQSNILTSAAIPGYIDKPVLIAKTEKLLNLRQNLFVVIVEVQVASGGNIPSNPARQRAVAIVWRDPFRDNFYVRSLIFF